MNIHMISGGVCAAQGFQASGVHCGIRKSRTKKDLSLIYSAVPAACAAVYTTNLVKGAPLTVTKNHLKNGVAQAVICNSGNANTCNANGVQIAEEMSALAAQALGIQAGDVVVASTGVIGEPLNIAPIAAGIPELVKALSPQGGADAAEGHSLKCPNCGAPMEIRSELDTILSETPENTHVYNSEESLRNAFPQKKKTRVWPIVLALMLAFSLVNRVKERLSPEPVQQLPTTVSSGSTLSLAPFGDHLYLEKQEDGSYHVVTDVLRADKLLDYERDSDNYYDEASDCWLWYNREVEPAVWQYWYEGISSDFGDWGWMEHDADGWYIEKSAGNWIPLPEKYDASGLWYIG